MNHRPGALQAAVRWGAVRRRSATQRFAGFSFRGLKPHGYRHKVAPRQIPHHPLETSRNRIFKGVPRFIRASSPRLLQMFGFGSAGAGGSQSLHLRIANRRYSGLPVQCHQDFTTRFFTEVVDFVKVSPCWKRIRPPSPRPSPPGEGESSADSHGVNDINGGSKPRQWKCAQTTRFCGANPSGIGLPVGGTGAVPRCAPGPCSAGVRLAFCGQAVMLGELN